jgi:hypothetical protein
MKKIIFSGIGFLVKNLLTWAIITLWWIAVLLWVNAFQNMTTAPGTAGNQSLSAPMLSRSWSLFNREYHSLQAISESVEWWNNTWVKRSFLTVATYTWNLWWLAWADAKCQQQASTYNLWWTWIAVLWDNTKNFRTRFNERVRNNNYKVNQIVNIQWGLISSSNLPYGGIPTSYPSYYSFLDNSFLISSLFTWANTSAEIKQLYANWTATANGSWVYFWSWSADTWLVQTHTCDNWTSVSVNGAAWWYLWQSWGATADYWYMYYTNPWCGSTYPLLCLEI